MESPFNSPVVKDYIEAAGNRDYQLMQCLVCVPAALRSARYIIKVVNALDIKRNVVLRLDKG